MIDYNKQVKLILEQLENSGIKKIIAFSGSCLKELEARAEIIVEDSFQVLQGIPIAIQTGGTEWDIQKIAADKAKKYNMPLIGIFPSRGAKYKLKNLDFAIEVEPRYGDSEWGDETEIFAKLPQGVEIIGGSLGTLVEFGHIMKMNDARINKGKEFIYVAPVSFQGRETTADITYNFPLRQELKACMPLSLIVENGREAAEFLAEKLELKL